jgi:hypothetical protein
MMKFLLVMPAVACAVMGGNAPLLDDTLEVSVGEYRYVSFRVQEAQGEDAAISGNIRISPDTSRVELILLTFDDFRRWNSGEDVDTLDILSTGSGGFRIPLPGFGDFVLLVSNRGNFHPAVVALTAELSFRGDGIQYDSLPMAFRLMLIILAAGVVVAAVLLAMRKLRE